MRQFRFWFLKNLMIIGNFIANFIGVNVIDIISRRSLAPPTSDVIDLARKIDGIFIPFSLLVNVVLMLLYERPIRRALGQILYTGKTLDEEALAAARRRLLNEPFVLMAFDLSIWVLAAGVYPLSFYLNSVNPWIILRSFFQTLLTGIITAIFAFFILERILQKRLVPIFFPDGGLWATPKTIRTRIKLRLKALMLAINIIPSAAIIIIICSTYTMDKSPDALLELLRPTFLTNSVIFLGVGILLTSLVGRNMTAPFAEIIAVLKNVRAGNLDQKVRVTTNDEIGYTGDTINEMTDGLKEREILRRSLYLAREVQQNLLPQSMPIIAGVDIAARSIYCDQTGGDYFDFIEFNDAGTPKVGALVGDVSGHGIPSALLMATARAFLRIRSSMPGNIAQVVSDANRQLTRDISDSGQFMTLFYLVLFPEEEKIRWVRAGHDPAIIYDAAEDAFEELKGKGLAMGIDENWQYEEYEKSWSGRGQTILIGTDGIWETRNLKGEMFGKGPIYDIIRQKSHAGAAEVVDAVFDALARFNQGRKAEDDITLIVIKTKKRGEDEPRVS